MDIAASVSVLGVPLILTGVVLASVGGVRLVAGGQAPSFAAPARPQAIARTDLLVLFAVLLVAAFVRLTGLDARGLMHPEIYIPGLDLPAGLSEPPPRHGLIETAKWHFHSEPHPFGYYLAMWAWTKAFGATAVSIRLPEAILGVLSVALTYRVGALVYGRRVGLLGAALLALHGFHIFWSQSARMYSPGAFLGLVATLLLLELSRRREPDRWLEAGYVASLVACALTVEFAWPLLAVHMLWAVLNQRPKGSVVSRLLVLQTLAAILAAPMLSHAVMTGRNDAAAPPTLDFLVQYFSFGFAFQHGAYSEPWNGLPAVFVPAVLAFGLVMMGLGLTRRPEDPEPTTLASADWPRLMAVAAAGACILMLGFMAISDARRKAMTVLSLAPWLMIAVPFVAAQIRPAVARILPWADRLIERRGSATGLVPLLSLVPVVFIFIISFKLTLTASRAFLIFIPYVLLLVAAGADRLASRRLAYGATVAALLAVMAASWLIVSKAPASPRDYRGLGAAIEADSRADDLIFVRPRHWLYTPLFLYVGHGRLVTQDFAAALARAPKARVWVPEFEDKPTPEMSEALKGYRVVTRVTGQRAAADLYVRPALEP